ncbi:MAG: hypothetical protein KAT68_09445 [Bacteroidales bacterium]|nr:hypothetical protein [Bacteroidales bacterium]
MKRKIINKATVHFDNKVDKLARQKFIAVRWDVINSNILRTKKTIGYEIKL